MKLGLLADIHEHVENLRRALRFFKFAHVDRIVVLGDVFELGKQIRETCRLLSAADAVGVWGNHDFGLSAFPDEEMVDRFGEDVINYMTTLKPHLRLGDCFFHHVEPWLDANKIEDLWYFEGPPNTPEKAERIFQSVPDHWMFSGHVHEWRLVSPEGLKDWQGETPITLSDSRYFVIVAALCDGYFATFDTETHRLTPYELATSNGCVSQK